MYEIEDFSLGQHELFTVKYPSTVNACPASKMDLYLGSSTFQEMLDIDIKNEMDNVFGGHELTFNFAELSDVDDTGCLGDGDSNVWFSNNSNHSSSNLFELRNEGASRMVNPNSVMPLNVLTRVLTPTLASSLNPDVDTPSPKRSHLTFSPASIDQNNSIKHEDMTVSIVKKDLTESLEKVDEQPPQKPILEEKKLLNNTINDRKETQYFIQTKQNLPKPIHILTTKSMAPKITTQNGHSILASNIKVSTNSRQVLVATPTITYSHLENKITHSQNRSQQIVQNTTTINRKKKTQEEEENPFPKPTYSYSCLIAMALKNSRTGSLPVSEIYNFMCEHFPYFKTAPAGWKNSVRHNLSLNKCFEKIEKPAVTGSQRKGCLWAMHPDKISKMDEEVQKWSRKDPAAIRRAMVYPEHLEALERGELKYGSESYGDSSGSGASDSETEEHCDDIESDNNITIKEEDINSQSDFIEINSLGDSYDEASLTDFDNEYESVEGNSDLVETDDDALRMEIALAQQELFNYQAAQQSSAQKRMRLSASNVEFMYQPLTAGRRKTPLVLRNNSNTSFIEIISGE